MPLHSETVTVHQKRSSDDTDERGNPIYLPPNDIVMEGCNVQPAGTEETLGEATPVTGRWRVSTHRGDVHEEITEDDTVTWRGEPYSILGRPGSYFAVRPHTEFIIEQTRG